MNDGLPNTEVSKLTGLGLVQVSRIRKRFAEMGAAGLQDRPRSGRPKAFLSKVIAKVIAVTVGDPPKGVSHWSSRAVAKACDVSQTLWSASRPSRKRLHDVPVEDTGPPWNDLSVA
jgi:transposase